MKHVIDGCLSYDLRHICFKSQMADLESCQQLELILQDGSLIELSSNKGALPIDYQCVAEETLERFNATMQAKAIFKDRKKLFQILKDKSRTQHYPTKKWGEENPAELIRVLCNFADKRDCFPRLPNKSIKISALGSCFATNVSNKLKEYGMQSVDFRLADEYNSALANRMLLSLDYQKDDQGSTLASASERDNGSKDFLQYLRRKGDIIARFGDFRNNLVESDIIIYTLGSALRLVNRKGVDPLSGRDRYTRDQECWHDLSSLNEITSDLKKVIMGIKHINPSAQFYITLSPIPIKGYKSGTALPSCMSPVEIDCLSKSLNRAAIGSLQCDKNWNKLFCYFPAYEIIRWIAPFADTIESKWSDPRHPHDDLIDFVTEIFYREFILGNVDAKD